MLLLYEERIKELELLNGAEKGDSSFEEGGSLEDALVGTTMTDLKLQIRKLTRQLAARASDPATGTSADLEKKVKEAEGMKVRYEGEYLEEHREVLLLKKRLEEIMSGKSRLGDGWVLFSLISFCGIG